MWCHLTVGGLRVTSSMPFLLFGVSDMGKERDDPKHQSHAGAQL